MGVGQKKYIAQRASNITAVLPSFARRSFRAQSIEREFQNAGFDPLTNNEERLTRFFETPSARATHRLFMLLKFSGTRPEEMRVDQENSYIFISTAEIDREKEQFSFCFTVKGCFYIPQLKSSFVPQLEKKQIAFLLLFIDVVNHSSFAMHVARVF